MSKIPLLFGETFGTIPQLISDAATGFGDSTWLVEAEGERRVIPFSRLGADVGRVAGALRERGIGQGDTVAASVPNEYEFFLAWFSVNWLGAVFVPLNPAFTVREASHIVGGSSARLWLFDGSDDQVAQTVRECAVSAERAELRALISESRPEQCCPPCQMSSTAPASLLYTSGTTGSPKACVCSHQYYLTTCRRFASVLELGVGDRLSTCLPLFHMGAQTTSTMASLLAGVPLILQRRFSASRFLRQLSDGGATVFNYIGAMPAILANAPADPADRAHKIRAAWGGGIPARIHADFERRFGFPMLEAYGMTEIGAALVCGISADRKIGTHCCGVAYEDADVDLFDPDSGQLVRGAGRGELVARGAGLFSGYLVAGTADIDPAVDRDGWFHTGDLLDRDSDGDYHYVDRMVDVLRRGGENVAAAEVERVIGTHPDVVDVAVVGAPDEVYGQVPVGFVVLRGEADPERATAEILKRCRDGLAYFKVPVSIQVARSFPRTSTHRVDKRTLLESLRSGDG